MVDTLLEGTGHEVSGSSYAQLLALCFAWHRQFYGKFGVAFNTFHDPRLTLNLPLALRCLHALHDPRLPGRK